MQLRKQYERTYDKKLYEYKIKNYWDKKTNKFYSKYEYLNCWIENLQIEETCE